MQSINYNHLLYFWHVAREGGLVQAGKVLRLSHPTLSAQIHSLEDRLGEKLFVKSGRRLVLTEVGRIAFRYADEIFSLGRELVDTVQERGAEAVRIDVGVVDAVPKLVVRRLLAPALELSQPVRIVCHEGTYDKLLADLSLHTLDIVFADAPVPRGSSVRAFNHLLGQCGVGIFAAEALAQEYRRDFPKSLDGAPMLVPLENSPLRRALNQWFEANHIKPKIVAEFEDDALLTVFGADGVGLFAAPLAVEAEIKRQHRVRAVGKVSGVTERFYAVSGERKLKNPAVVALTEAARLRVFGTR
jgi:LysR family transcriptional regulator, transcriptional activator of nhaA